MVRRSFTFHRGLAALVLLAGVVATLRGEDPPQTRAQEIAEIQKQLANLEKKLAELKKGTPATAGTRKPVTLAEAPRRGDQFVGIRSRPMARGSPIASGRRRRERSHPPQ